MEIYIACLSSYNAGKLYGDWIDVDGMSAEEVRNKILAILKEEIQNKILAVLKASIEEVAEEWAVHDYKGFPNLGEHPSLEAITTVAKIINDHSLEAVEAFLSFYSLDDIESFDDRYCGKHESVEDYAKKLYKGQYTIPKELYIDWEQVANDLECNGLRIKDGHVFQAIPSKSC